MKIIIKSKNKQPVPQDLRLIIEEKIMDVFKENQETTICELALAANKTVGATKEIQITCTIAHIKNPVHITASSENYYKTVDVAQGKLKRAIHRAKVKSNQAEEFHGIYR